MSRVPPRSLDEWYRRINSIYLDRNFYRSTESLYAHLVEVIGGLSIVASGKRRESVVPSRFLAKSLGWWMTLCGRVGVSSVEDMIWAKFPGVCTYCLQIPHSAKRCKEARGSRQTPDWDRLREIGIEKEGEKPRSADDWQAMFSSIYPRSEETTQSRTFVRVIEEIGELGEAVRLLPLTRRFFLNEASDVFAWLMAEANQLLHDASNESTEDFRVEALLWNEYPGLCHFCGREQCKCSPIPPHTLGRISTETPPSAFRPERGEPLFGPEDALAFFQVGMETISIADQQVTLTLDALAELDETLRGVINELERKSERTDASLIEILGRLQAMASAHQVSEEEFQALEADLSSLQPGAKSSLIEILNGMASGIWTEILLRLLQ